MPISQSFLTQFPLYSPSFPFRFFIKAEVAGIVVWKVKPGETVKKGETLGEIVDIENPDAERTMVVSRTDGVVFSVVRHRLVRPGQVIVKVAGSSVLHWRTGNLLTSK